MASPPSGPGCLLPDAGPGETEEFSVDSLSGVSECLAGVGGTSWRPALALPAESQSVSQCEAGTADRGPPGGESCCARRVHPGASPRPTRSDHVCSREDRKLRILKTHEAAGKGRR